MNIVEEKDLGDSLKIAHELMEADHLHGNRLVLQMVEFSNNDKLRFEIFSELLEELKIYVLHHYDREESFMEISDYPRTLEHKRAHAKQITEISHVAEAVVTRNRDEVRRLTQVVLQSWKEHRILHDMELHDFFHARAREAELPEAPAAV